MEKLNHSLPCPSRTHKDHNSYDFDTYTEDTKVILPHWQCQRLPIHSTICTSVLRCKGNCCINSRKDFLELKCKMNSDADYKSSYFYQLATLALLVTKFLQRPTMFWIKLLFLRYWCSLTLFRTTKATRIVSWIVTVYMKRTL